MVKVLQQFQTKKKLQVIFEHRVTLKYHWSWIGWDRCHNILSPIYSVLTQLSNCPVFLTYESVIGISCTCIHLGITVNVVGKAKVHWQKTKYSGNRTHTVHYRAEEVYFNERITVYGSGMCITSHSRQPFYKYIVGAFFYVKLLKIVCLACRLSVTRPNVTKPEFISPKVFDLGGEIWSEHWHGWPQGHRSKFRSHLTSLQVNFEVKGNMGQGQRSHGSRLTLKVKVNCQGHQIKDLISGLIWPSYR